LYTASWGQLRITGDVNGGPSGLNGEYVIAPEPHDWYLQWPWNDTKTDIVDSLERHLIEELDAYVDYNDYDSDGDGYVDFVFFILPRSPVYGLVYEKNNGYAQGMGDDLKRSIETQDESVHRPGENVKVCRRIRLGSTHTYYNPDPDKQIDRCDASNLMCHELGHSFGTGSVGFVNSDAFPDRYNNNRGGNYDKDVGEGKYTVMQLGYNIRHPMLYAPWERAHVGRASGFPGPWIEATVIDTNVQFIRLRDFNTIPRTGHPEDWDSMLYRIPIDSVQDEIGRWLHEYFLVANYQQSGHWMDELGKSWPEQFSQPPVDDAKGVLIYHINELWWYEDGKLISGLMKLADIECAEGYRDTCGQEGAWTHPWPKEEMGWDRFDRYCPGGAYVNWTKEHEGSSTHKNDFFRPGYQWAFTSLTNPSSDGYNLNYKVDFEYPDGTAGCWVEQGYRQNVATHISIEGISYYPNDYCPNPPEEPGDMMLCIRRSRIWSDQQGVADRTS
jgi:hypothetical protein